MENEIYENGFAPETEVPQQPAATVETAVFEETAEAPQKKGFADILNTVVDKGKELYANRATIWEKIKAVPMKLWIMIGSGVAALIAIIIVLSLLGNTYKTPIKAAEKLLNSKSVNQVINRAPAVLNGFGEKDAKALITIAKKSDMYKDNVEQIEDAFDSVIEMLEDNAGKNYKIKLKVTDKEKLDKDDVKAFRDQLRMIGKMGSQLDDLDNDNIEDAADELGLSKAKVKKAIKIAKGFCKDCKGAKVKKGYALTVEVKITGKELDEPTELEIPINVYKVNGRWVPDVFSLAEDAMDLVGGAMLGGMMGGMMGGYGDMSGLMGGF